MQAAVFYGKHQIKIEEAKTPTPGPGEALVSVKACGICGTDLHIFHGDQGSFECNPPRILGHEFSGVVEKLGDGVTSLSIGDKVAIDPNELCGQCEPCLSGKGHYCMGIHGYGTSSNGGFAQYCVVPAKQLHKFTSLSFQEAAMAEPISCCIHGMDLTKVTLGDNVLIIGGGTIGLIMLQLAKLSGAAKLVVIEPVSEKRQLAMELGADLVIDPSVGDAAQQLSGIEFNKVIECAGKAKTVQQAIQLAGNCATVMLFGLTEPDCTIPLKPYDVFKKELTITASFINPYTIGRALALLESGKILVKPLISQIEPLHKLPEILESFNPKGKVLIQP